MTPGKLLIQAVVVLYASTRWLSSKTTFNMIEPVKDITQRRRHAGSLLNYHDFGSVSV
jgi:hypothetical protein